MKNIYLNTKAMNNVIIMGKVFFTKITKNVKKSVDTVKQVHKISLVTLHTFFFIFPRK